MCVFDSSNSQYHRTLSTGEVAWEFSFGDEKRCFGNKDFKPIDLWFALSPMLDL